MGEDQYKIMCNPDIEEVNVEHYSAMQEMNSDVGVVQMVKPALAFGLKFVEAHCVIQEVTEQSINSRTRSKYPRCW